jgi:hypothetical protein
MTPQNDLSRETPESAEPLLARACELLRQSRWTADLSLVPVVVVIVGEAGRFGDPRPGLIRALLTVATGIAALAGLFWAIRSRRTVSAALSDLRTRTGSPVQRVPWTAIGIDRPFEGDLLAREVRRLLGAAYASSRQAEIAAAWSVASLVLYLLAWR